MRIQIQTSTGVPITRQIAQQIRALCASGTLVAGERLPSVRELAKRLTINPNTVLRVYERLTAEGLLDRRHGDGTYVSQHPPTGQLKAQRALLENDIERVVQRASLLGLSPEQLHQQMERARERLTRMGSIQSQT